MIYINHTNTHYPFRCLCPPPTPLAASWKWKTQVKCGLPPKLRPIMARGQGKGKNPKGKRNGAAKGRNTFLDLPSPTRSDSQPHPQASQSPPQQAPLLNPHDISWGSDSDNSSAQPTPLTNPYQNPTLARVVSFSCAGLGNNNKICQPQP